VPPYGQREIPCYPIRTLFQDIRRGTGRQHSFRRASAYTCKRLRNYSAQARGRVCALIAPLGRGRTLRSATVIKTHSFGWAFSPVDRGACAFGGQNTAPASHSSINQSR